MKFKAIFKKICSSLLFFTILTTISNAQTISSGKYDLDLNGTKEWIQLYVDKIDKNTSLPSYMEIKYNVPGDIVPASYDGIDIPNKDELAYNNIKVIDINPNDSQKEIMLMLRGTKIFYNEVRLYSLVNEKLRYLGKVEYISDLENVGVNKKKNRLEVMSETGFPIQSIYYRKFMISAGKLKETTPNEVNISYFNKKIVLTAQKSINVYANTKFDKKAYEIKSGEKIAFVSANQKSGYAKVQNSKGKIGYIQITVTPDKYSYALKQYPNVWIEGDADSPFIGGVHWD